VLVPLKYAKKGQHKYRIGNYRVICTLSHHELLVVAIRVGHRKDMYQK
ncbi:MAG TPA: type II toxin-antitoxin system mRNA interferase toxin, RelE/StbE family, partial [Erysipelotrichaceae bacterium]|nr:type II toxin-antitoxin system mRNA interferase toxin, RelE/StbE family [Erysipelotrichaceae bacterium]